MHITIPKKMKNDTANKLLLLITLPGLFIIATVLLILDICRLIKIVEYAEEEERK